MTRVRTDQVLPALAVACTVVGGLSLGVAVVATQGLYYAGFVSEAGVPGQPHVGVYRLGIYGVAFGLILLGLSTRRLPPDQAGPAWLGPARLVQALPLVLLVTSGALALASGSVSCTAQCPLPPYATPTPWDLVHGVVSTLGVALCAAVVLLLALAPTAGPLRRASRLALGPVVVFSAMVAFGLVALGRGHVIGVGERSDLVAVTLWMVAAGVILAVGLEGRPDRLRRAPHM